MKSILSLFKTSILILGLVLVAPFQNNANAQKTAECKSFYQANFQQTNILADFSNSDLVTFLRSHMKNKIQSRNLGDILTLKGFPFIETALPSENIIRLMLEDSQITGGKINVNTSRFSVKKVDLADYIEKNFETVFSNKRSADDKTLLAYYYFLARGNKPRIPSTYRFTLLQNLFRPVFEERITATSSLQALSPEQTGMLLEYFKMAEHYNQAIVPRDTALKFAAQSLQNALPANSAILEKIVYSFLTLPKDKVKDWDLFKEVVNQPPFKTVDLVSIIAFISADKSADLEQFNRQSKHLTFGKSPTTAEQRQHALQTVFNIILKRPDLVTNEIILGLARTLYNSQTEPQFKAFIPKFLAKEPSDDQVLSLTSFYKDPLPFLEFHVENSRTFTIEKLFTVIRSTGTADIPPRDLPQFNSLMERAYSLVTDIPSKLKLADLLLYDMHKNIHGQEHTLKDMLIQLAQNKLTFDEFLKTTLLSRFSPELFKEISSKLISAQLSISELKKVYDDLLPQTNTDLKAHLTSEIATTLVQKITQKQLKLNDLSENEQLKYLVSSLNTQLSVTQRISFIEYFRSANAVTKNLANDQWLLRYTRSNLDSQMQFIFEQISTQYYHAYRNTDNLTLLFSQNTSLKFYLKTILNISAQKSHDSYIEIENLLRQLANLPLKSDLPLKFEITELKDWIGFARTTIPFSKSKNYDKTILDFILATFKAGAKEDRLQLIQLYRDKYPSEREFILEKAFLSEDLAELTLKEFLSDTKVTTAESNEIIRSMVVKVPGFEAVARSVATKYRMGIAKEKIKSIESLIPSVLADRQTQITTDLVEIPQISRTMPTAEILRGQNEVNTQIQRRLDSIARSGVIPTPHSNWHSFVTSLPQSEQSSFVRNILNAHSSNFTIISQVIREIPQTLGLRDVVLGFLSRSPLIQQNNLTNWQISELFPEGKFRFYFPEFIGDRNGQNISIQLFRAAIALALKQTVTIAQLRSTSLSMTLGYAPIVTTGQFGNILSNVPTPGSKENLDLAKGLLMQGFYERNGYSIMNRSTSRGDQQVEDELPALHLSLKSVLTSGRFSKLDMLSKRYLVYGWGLQSSGQLIESVRQRAIRVANSWDGFWNLRVEIHNFPTLDVLKRVEQIASRAPSMVSSELTLLIQEIKQLHGMATGGPNGLHTSLANVQLAGATKSALLGMTSLLSGDPRKDLGTLLTMRNQLAQGLIADPNNSLIPYFIADRIISEHSFILSEKLVQASNPLANSDSYREFKNDCNLLLEQVYRDNHLSETQLSNIKAEIDRVATDANLSAIRKVELMSHLVENAVEQVYFMFEEKFSSSDSAMNSLMRGMHPDQQTTPHFIDSTLRSSNVFMLSKLVDKAKREITLKKQIEHKIDNKVASGPIEVFNPGMALGILRFNKDPMTLTKDEIAVFTEVPGETSALGGIITLGTGARLSHLQLLAKSLRIPNLKFDKSYEELLKSLDGKTVSISAGKDGVIKIDVVSSGNSGTLYAKNTGGRPVVIPTPDHSVRTPINFDSLKEINFKFIAGPKGIQLGKMRTHRELKNHVPDGFILPFGYFDKYASATGIKRWFRVLSRIKLENTFVVSTVLEKIQRAIETTPIPTEMLDQAMHELQELQKRTGADGFFFRSDTNMEDLPDFNGAGLNESVANVIVQRAEVEKAIRKVWKSAFSQKSVYWRGLAINKETVSIAEPSIVVMPTIEAQSSGVVISRGGTNWQSGRGFISANWGIGSVVESGRPVEEITFENGSPQFFSMTATNKKPVVDKNGGLTTTPVEPGIRVLSDENAAALIRFANTIESHLGQQPHGWDIEWAFDRNNKLKILQARPNM